MKRLISILLALTLLSGCSSQSPAESETSSAESSVSESSSESSISIQTDTLRLPFDANDSLNPFSCESDMNSRLIPLMHRSLILLNSDYSTAPDLALNVSSSDRVNYRITLREDAVFSDGTPLTAKDVVVSLQAARASGRYASVLSNVGECAEVDEYTVAVSLYRADPNFASLLTFPIVRFGSQADDAPVGCGLYIRTSDSELTLNEGSGFSKDDASIHRIELIPVTDYKALLYLLSTDTIDAAVTDLLPGDMNLSGSVVYTDENRLLYLGLNRSGTVSQPLAYAIASALERSLILRECYADCGAVAETVFNSRSSDFGRFDSGIPTDTAVLADYLESIGYAETEGSEYPLKNGAVFTLTLLVNSDNPTRTLAAREIQRQLKECGVNVELSALPYARYITALQSGSYDLYLAEVCIPFNHDISYLLYGGSSVAYGQLDSGLLGSWQQVLDGSMKCDAFIKSFESALPFIPLLYHDTAFAFNWEVQGDITPCIDNIFANINAWNIYEVTEK